MISENLKSKYRGKTALMVDNYDSFTYNLVQYFMELGVRVETHRNDEVPITKVSSYDFVIISPGPSSPDEAGQSLATIAACEKENVPLLGICLGHQCIGQYFGGKVVRFEPPMHGKVSEIVHQSQDIYTGLSSPLNATRYHSLVVDRKTFPEVLDITSESRDGVIQSLKHKEKPLVGIQYHPESVLTEKGHDLLANFIELYV